MSFSILDDYLRLRLAAFRTFFLGMQLLDWGAPDCSVCYARRLLYGGACILSFAIIGMMCVGIYMGFDHFVGERQQRFMIQRDLLKGEVDRYPLLLRQLVVGYETIDHRQVLHDLSWERYQQLLQQQNNVMVTDREIAVTPFTVLSTLTGKQDSDSLAMLLRLVQEMSRLPFIHVRESNSPVSGFAYSVDHRFFAVTPPLSAIALHDVKQNGVPLEIAKKISGIEAEILKYSEQELLDQSRVVWVPLSFDSITGEPVLHIAKPVFNQGKRVAVVVFTLSFLQFERLFQQSRHDSDFLVIAQDHYALFGLAATKAREASWAKRLRAVPDFVIERANNRGLFVYYAGAFFITQKIAGPDWVAVHVFDWFAVIQYLRKELWISVAVLFVLLCILWGFVVLLDRIVLAAMQRKSLAVYESEAFNRTVLAMAPVGLAVLDPVKQVILMQNEIACGLTGLQAGDGGGFYCLLLDNTPFSVGLNKDCKPPVLRKEVAACAADGRQVELVADLTWARYQDQDVVFCALTDITERKSAEKLLEKARQLADEANKAKSMFLAMMSHEIRTPLHGALGNLELLEGEDLSAPQRARLITIRHAFDALLVLINNILDLSKIGAQELKLELMPVRVGELIERCAQIFSPLLERKGLYFYCLIDPRLFALWELDGHRLSQVIMNLLSNAVKFTQAGAITLYATADESHPGASRITLSVADSGVGIPACRQAAVFDFYMQADEGVARHFGGSGLGLSLCKRLLELAGGSISLESKEGEGSIFTIELPSVKMAEIAEPKYPDSALCVSEVWVVCKLPAWRDILLEQVKLQLPEVDVGWAESVDELSGDEPHGMSHKVLLIAHYESSLPLDCQPGQLSGMYHIVVVSSDGPLCPETRDGITYVTSLSYTALGHTLAACAYRQDMALPIPHQQYQALNSKQGVRVLIAEDDETNCLLLEHQLHALGYTQVDSVSDGQQALISCLQQSYDIVITDLYMPVMGGQDLLKAMRQFGIATPLLVNTANAYDDWRVEGEDFAAVLQKPLTIAQLGQTLGRVLCVSGAEMPDPGAQLPETLRDATLEKVFLASWESDRGQLQNAVESGDFKRFEHCLHKVKGGLFVMNESLALQACEALQRLLRSGETIQISALLSDFMLIMSDVVSRYKGHA
ncbi:hybrid sensor histidine kinase/response regulator [Iodobacter ciconiae]|uniref:Virulence sensor protein BvgS n=1 Tax=Iodobacter ciconiae TaxID=2496266 RepID=A0A3S8ZR01_9NEIS|nr:hybrid sensor histidine kinase/response regulator [Iodobacter ciconiae]AZN35908.1 hybrid sensor histidine kinase/response regulator [Iodobacter ciconiae]